jgi:hypothetical protein
MEYFPDAQARQCYKQTKIPVFEEFRYSDGRMQVIK